MRCGRFLWVGGALEQCPAPRRASLTTNTTTTGHLGRWATAGAETIPQRALVGIPRAPAGPVAGLCCVILLLRLMVPLWGLCVCSTAPSLRSTSVCRRGTLWCATAPRRKQLKLRNPCTCAFWVTPPSWRSLLERRKWLVFSLRLSHSHRPAALPTPPWVSGARRPLRGAVTQGAELTGPRQSCYGVESSNRIPVYGGRSVERRVEWWEVPYPWTRCSPETCWTERTCRPAGNRGIKKKNNNKSVWG